MEDGRMLEDEELDDVLEREFQRAQSPKDPLRPPLPHNPPQPSSLTFSFPGWGVQIFRDSKRLKPSIIRHASQEDAQTQQEEAEFRTLALGFADDPGNGHSVYQMPTEIMVNILKRLSIKDLCSAMRTCHWWQHLGSQDDVWQQFHKSNETPIPLPRWGLVKHDALSFQIQTREVSGRGYFCKGFSHLRNALRAWWDTEKPSEPYGSKSIGGLLHKMSVRDWTMVYEYLGIIFSERADCLAALVLKEVKKQADKHVQSICPFGCDHQSRHEEDEMAPSSDNHVVFSENLLSSIYASEEHQSAVESLIGKSLWGTVYSFWKRYKQWLMLVFEHCPRLNFQVMVEKARATAWTTTPSLYEKGVICFRSQILLRYGLRRILQSGYTWLTFSDANGLTSESEIDLLQSIQHLLQEVDVRDDTLSTQAFTQTKMRRCFPARRLSDSQTRHIQDKNKKLCSF